MEFINAEEHGEWTVSMKSSDLKWFEQSLELFEISLEEKPLISTYVNHFSRTQASALVLHSGNLQQVVWKFKQMCMYILIVHAKHRIILSQNKIRKRSYMQFKYVSRPTDKVVLIYFIEASVSTHNNKIVLIYGFLLLRLLSFWTF